MKRWKKMMAFCFAFLMSFVMFGSSENRKNAGRKGKRKLSTGRSAITLLQIISYNLMKFKVCGVTICPQRSGGEEQRSTVPCWPVWYPHNIFIAKTAAAKRIFSGRRWFHF